MNHRRYLSHANFIRFGIWIPALIFFLFTTTLDAACQSLRQYRTNARYISLDGKWLKQGNPIDADGNVLHCQVPLLRLFPTRSDTSKGTMMLIPGGSYKLIALQRELEKTGMFLNSVGFDVVTLDYRVSAGQAAHDQALKDALKAFHFLSNNRAKLHLGVNRLGIIGFGSGAHLAARLIQKLSDKAKPTDLILISPEGFNEKIPGTVLPAIVPPLLPTTRLLTIFSSGNTQSRDTAVSEYLKTWRGYDGQEIIKVTENGETAPILYDFLCTTLAGRDSMINPATVPVPGYSAKRHQEKLELVTKEKFDLVLIGNSITNNFEKPEYQAVWNQFFAPRKALNLGYSGYRTENILWNIQHGELEGQSPKVVILEIGTNNVDEKNYPTRHTAGQLAGGIKDIVRLLREKVPEAKIILLRCFPGCYGGPNPTSHRAILERASDLVSGLADGQHIFFCDVNHVFLNFDGSINHSLMPDWLHPSPAGAKAWAQAMEPLLSQLFGDSSLDKDIPANTAIVPASKLEADSYDWWDRHAEVLRIKDSIDPEIVLIGNSITHFWGGSPALKYANSQPRTPNGPLSWAGLFGHHRVLNLGFGWDRTQNVLWRLDHGELDGLHPRIVVIDVGTNNTSQTDHARMNTAPEIVEGIVTVCRRVRSKVPGARILLMAIFPREKDPSGPRRLLINEVNKQLETFAKQQELTYVDIGPHFLRPDGTFLPGVTIDYTHPTDKGYQIWANGIRPFVDAP